MPLTFRLVCPSGVYICIGGCEVEGRGGEVEFACHVLGEREPGSHLKTLGSVYVTVSEKTDHLAPM